MLASLDFKLSLSQSISLERTTWEGGGGRQDQEGTSDLKHSWKQFLVGFICPVSSSYIPQMMAGCPVFKTGFGPMTEESKKLKKIVIFDLLRPPALWSSQNVFDPPAMVAAVFDFKGQCRLCGDGGEQSGGSSAAD